LRDKALANTLEQPYCVDETLHRECYDEFTDRSQLTVAAPLDDFKALKFEPCDAIDDRYVLQPVTKISAHVPLPSSDRCCATA